MALAGAVWRRNQLLKPRYKSRLAIIPCFEKRWRERRKKKERKSFEEPDMRSPGATLLIFSFFFPSFFPPSCTEVINQSICPLSVPQSKGLPARGVNAWPEGNVQKSRSGVAPAQPHTSVSVQYPYSVQACQVVTKKTRLLILFPLGCGCGWARCSWLAWPPPRILPSVGWLWRSPWLRVARIMHNTCAKRKLSSCLSRHLA